MAKTTTVTTSYTSDIVANGTAIPADKIYANGTQVRRCIVNGKDVIHKFTRTVVTASSNLTLKVAVSFTSVAHDLVSDIEYRFSSPIYVDVIVTDNGNSGFTSVTCLTPRIVFYCLLGDKGSTEARYHEQQLPNQRIPIGQRTTLTFSDFQNKYIYTTAVPDTQATHYELSFRIKDPDAITTQVAMNSPNDISSDLLRHRQTMTYPRVINKVLSDDTVQEY